MALKDKKLPPGFKPDETLVAEINRLKEADGTISCAAALRLSVKAGAKPKVTGRSLDARSIPISRCQLGLFGYPGHAKGWEAAGPDEEFVSEGLSKALRTAAGPQKRISCLGLWKIAKNHRISRMQAGLAADRAGLKIIACQLGAF
jgi:hypothetical protein